MESETSESEIRRRLDFLARKARQCVALEHQCYALDRATSLLLRDAEDLRKSNREHERTVKFSHGISSQEALVQSGGRPYLSPFLSKPQVSRLEPAKSGSSPAKSTRSQKTPRAAKEPESATTQRSEEEDEQDGVSDRSKSKNRRLEEQESHLARASIPRRESSYKASQVFPFADGILITSAVAPIAATHIVSDTTTVNSTSQRSCVSSFCSYRIHIQIRQAASHASILHLHRFASRWNAYASRVFP